MTGECVKPDDCATMAEVRHGVDRLDEAIVALLGERFRYMDAAARIKQGRADVRDEARKAEVIGNALRLAAGAGIPAAVIERLYELLVEASIGYELDAFDRRARRKTAPHEAGREAQP
ncbi:MAG TPA: chorismate mutase [Allosphingosinicella sp.]|nr:chorismate mutase [Allosphingosinicella sp.]